MKIVVLESSPNQPLDISLFRWLMPKIFDNIPIRPYIEL